MIYALNWFAVLSLLALWSALVWLVHAAAGWALANAGSLPAATSAAGALQLPEWLQPWVPPEMLQLGTAMLTSLGPAVEWLLQALPAVSGMLSVAAWLVWGLVAMLLLVLGAALHALIVWWRRSGQGAVATAARRAAGLRPSA